MEYQGTVEFPSKEHSDENPQQGVLTINKLFNFPNQITMYNTIYNVTDYSVFYESRGKTLLSCKINNVECVAKRVKEMESAPSILSLYLPCEFSGYCFSLKGKCLGDMFNGNVIQESSIDICNFVKDMLCTLVLLERKHLTHNDIKPDNIVQYENHWFLIDYELSKPFKFKCGKYFDSNNGQLRCERYSRGYRSPERIKHKLVSPKSDMYSLGLIILELVMGKRLSALEDPFQVQQYLKQVQSSLMVEVDDVIESCHHGKAKEMLFIVNHLLPCILQFLYSPTSLFEKQIINSISKSFESELSNTLQFFQKIEYFREEKQLFSNKNLTDS